MLASQRAVPTHAVVGILIPTTPGNAQCCLLIRRAGLTPSGGRSSCSSLRRLLCRCWCGPLAGE